jgi:hypothetical protein
MSLSIEEGQKVWTDAYNTSSKFIEGNLTDVEYLNDRR